MCFVSTESFNGARWVDESHCGETFWTWHRVVCGSLKTFEGTFWWEPNLPHRPLPWKGNGAELNHTSLCQSNLSALVDSRCCLKVISHSLSSLLFLFIQIFASIGFFNDSYFHSSVTITQKEPFGTEGRGGKSWEAVCWIAFDMKMQRIFWWIWDHSRHYAESPHANLQVFFVLFQWNLWNTHFLFSV